MLYSLARPLLFSLAPERAHELTLSLLKSSHKMGLMRQNVAAKPVTCMGIEFPNPVGLAAGLDKNGAYMTPLPVKVLVLLKLVPLPRDRKPAILIRVYSVCHRPKPLLTVWGFNNDGVDQLVENVKAAKFKGILGINIGKNADTPVEKAVDDYLHLFRKSL